MSKPSLSAQCTDCQNLGSMNVYWNPCANQGKKYPMPTAPGQGFYSQAQTAMNYPPVADCDRLRYFSNDASCGAAAGSAPCTDCQSCTTQALSAVEGYSSSYRVCCRPQPYTDLDKTWGVQKPFTL